MDEVAVEGAGFVGPVVFNRDAVNACDGEIRAALVGRAHFEARAVDDAVERVVGAVGGDAGLVYGIYALAIGVDEVDVWPIAG